MNQYITTFYSHFGAIRYKKLCDQYGCTAKVMPVPRSLSSSCGTCVGYTGEEHIIDEKYLDEIEQIVMVVSDGYEIIYSSEDE
ncbi:MAG: DUF3343 domain-containing protein [Lachnospiraceae bacterium]|nr:DUF3343 domain-containing protein [Candidatus Colinaster scatohippi]